MYNGSYLFWILGEIKNREGENVYYLNCYEIVLQDNIVLYFQFLYSWSTCAVISTFYDIERFIGLCLTTKTYADQIVMK